MQHRKTPCSTLSSLPLSPLSLVPTIRCTICRELTLLPGICDGCFADAAKDCCRRLEQALIGHGFVPGTDELKAQLAGATKLMSWYEVGSTLGPITYPEALRLRTLTESACLLVALGGVASLSKLPGTRSIDPAFKFEHSMECIGLDWSALPGRQRAGNLRPLSSETRFQIGTGVALLLAAVLLVVCR